MSRRVIKDERGLVPRYVVDDRGLGGLWLRDQHTNSAVPLRSRHPDAIRKGIIKLIATVYTRTKQK